MSLTFASGKRLNKASTVVSALPLSFSAWVNVTSFATSTGYVGVCLSTGATSFGWHLYGDTTGAVIAEQISSANSGSAITTVKISLNTWTHVAAVFTSTTSRTAYVAGANPISGSTTLTTPSSLTNTLIGSIYQGAFFDCVGSVAFVGIWSVALGATDVASLNAGASPLKVQPASLKSYCPGVFGTSPEPDLISGSYALTSTPTLNASNPRISTPF